MDKNQDKKTHLRTLDEEDTGNVSGGALDSIKYSKGDYEAAGIKVCPRIRGESDFIISKTGRKITAQDANAIVGLRNLKRDTAAMEKSLKSHIRKAINDGNFETDFFSYDA